MSRLNNCVALLVVVSSFVTVASLSANDSRRLIAPETGKITVGFLLGPGANVIDFTGPWEVFQDTVVPTRGTTPNDTYPFELVTISHSAESIRLTGGLHVIPDYTFENAPPIDIIVIPAQSSSPPEKLEWLKKAAAEADMTMSVCTGAFLLARAGLLDGRVATTHHDFLDQLADSFPAIDVKREVRYVEGPRIATAAGLTSGVDLALRIVERYFDRAVAERTAAYMEHSSRGWIESEGHWDDSVPAESAAAISETAAPASVLMGLDPVLLTRGEEVAGVEEIWLEHGGYRYLFASAESRDRFNSEPDLYEIQFDGACAYMASSGARPGSGNPDRYWVHDGRIYIFATENCRVTFKADPGRYLD